MFSLSTRRMCSCGRLCVAGFGISAYDHCAQLKRMMLTHTSSCCVKRLRNSLWCGRCLASNQSKQRSELLELSWVCLGKFRRTKTSIERVEEVSHRSTVIDLCVHCSETLRRHYFSVSGFLRKAIVITSPIDAASIQDARSTTVTLTLAARD